MVTAAAMWPLNEEGSWFFDFGIFEIHLFVMELFFVISGFMFGLELNRRSIPKIIKNRIQRIVLPFVVGVTVFTPFILSLRSFHKYPGYSFLKPENLIQSYKEGWSLGLENFFPTGHLWFLYYLIFFYVLTISLRTVLDKIKIESIFKFLTLGIFISS